MSQFEELFANLNSRQKEAVEAIEGPVMVIAGPGTGKTQILTLRIANILKTIPGITPDNILALTFTEHAVHQMRDRLRSIIGAPAYRVAMYTFHGFCNRVIGDYPDYFRDLLSRRPAGSIDQISVMRDSIQEADLDLLRPFGDHFYYVASALSAISNLKREGVAPAAFLKIIAYEQSQFDDLPGKHHEKGAHAGMLKGVYAARVKRLQKNKELHALYVQYQKNLKKAGLYDYDDMIVEVVGALTADRQLLMMLQEQFQYLLVDEHQDTNNAQNKVIELLGDCRDEPNIFVVGDEKQAIFRFQGASLENFLYFKKMYPRARLISLRDNYRSTQHLIDGALAMIAKNTRRIADIIPELREEGLVSRAGRLQNQTIQILQAPTDEDEIFAVAYEIQKLLEQGIPAGEIAVIYREHEDADDVIRALSYLGISYRLNRPQAIFENPHIRPLIALFEYLANPGHDELLLEVLHAPFLGISALDALMISRLAQKEKRPMLWCMQRAPQYGDLLQDAVQIKKIAQLLGSWKSFSVNRRFLELFSTVIEESGFLSYLAEQADAATQFALLARFFEEIKKLASSKFFQISDFVRAVSLMRSYRIKVSSTTVPTGVKDEVNLMTAHASKGLEFEYVFVMKVFDGRWGNKRTAHALVLPDLIRLETKNSQEGEEEKDRLADDERRLLYVAISRARRQAFLSYGATDAAGTPRAPSQFLSEIPDFHSAPVDPSQYEAARREAHNQLIFQNPVAPAALLLDPQYVEELFEERGFSATALNNFLECPWRYFYINLIRTPQTTDKFQMYGIAVHAALRDFFETLKKKKRSSPAVLVKFFQQELDRQPLSAAEKKELTQKGTKALSGYYRAYQKSWNTNVKTELRISDVSLPPRGSIKREIRLTGFLDKVEFLGTDPGYVNVVDYKTGKYRSRNELEGKTKQADGNYYRQLVFYKILVDDSISFPYLMKSGEIDFVEPDARGSFRRELFAISPQEAQMLKKQIYQVVESILDLSFADKGCATPDCRYCYLAQALKR